MRPGFLLLTLCFSTSITFGQIQFSEVTNQTGLKFIGKNYGAAIADFNRDGYDDIFAFSQQAPCRLYRNNGNGTFTDVAAAVGVAFNGTPNVAGWVDINNDGLLDLFIGNREGFNVLYLGVEDGTFIEHTFLSGLLNGSNVKAVLFADVNLDGNIDIYLARLNMENILYLNMGNSQFLNFTNNSGATDHQISMGAVFFDYDNDGDPDLYLTHDANQPNILYQNDGTGHFTNVAAAAGADVAGYGMGVDVGDINNDGWLDIYITNLYDNFLLVNNGDGTFSEIATAAGVNDGGMGWGCTFLDVDNDGWQDIYAANDSYFSPRPNLLYHNKQDLTFEIISENSPLESMQPGYGTATLDFNNDGKMDIYLANYVGEIGNQLFRNDSKTENNWVKIKAEGTVSNRSAIGARVTIKSAGQLWTDEIVGTSGYATQNSLTLHFGLGQINNIDQLTIRWPNGLEEVYENLPVNTVYTLVEGAGYTTPTVDFKNGQKLISAFPNPFHDRLMIKTEIGFTGNTRVTLQTIHGHNMEEFTVVNLLPGVTEFELNSGNIPAGFYFLKIECKGEVEIIKLVKN